MSKEGYEKKFINEAFDTNWLAPLGPNVDAFEKEMQDVVGAKGTLALSSGSAALHLALLLAGAADYKQKVFCQSLTFSAPANAIVYCGAEPVFIDSERETWNMSPDALRKAFERYPECKIVIVVYLYGMTADMDQIRGICREHNAILIEDAAESVGSTYKGQHTGTLGDYAAYSFNGNKIITTTGGGMLLSNRDDAEEKLDKAKFWATQSREPERHYEHKELGFNYRMSNVLAGIGRGQLLVLPERIEKKQEIFKTYREGFKDINDITMMPADSSGELTNCWLSSLVLDDKSKVKPLDIILALEKENIEARPLWNPMHLQEFFSDCEYVDNGGVAEDLFKHGVCMPSDTKMTEEQQQEVIGIVKGLW